MMRRVGWLAKIVLLTGIVGVATAQDGPPAGSPKLALSLETWDFGTKWYGEDCETEVTMENTGDAPLVISKVRSSCGCTVAKPSNAPTWNDFTLAPGQKESFKLSYNTKKVRPKVSQTVTIESNDPLRPTVQLQITGAIKQLFEMQPTSRIVFTNADTNTNETQELTLTSNVDKPVKLELESPENENIRFDARLEEVQEGKVYKLTVATKPPLSNGANNAILKIKTNHAGHEELTVPVSAFVAPRVTVSPRRLFVPRNASNKTERFVRIRYKTDKPLEVKAVTSSHPSIAAELAPPKMNRPNATIAMHEIKVTLPPASELPEDGGTITIKTDDAEFPEFTVQVDMQPMPRAARVTPTNVARMQESAENADEDSEEDSDD